MKKQPKVNIPPDVAQRATVFRAAGFINATNLPICDYGRMIDDVGQIRAIKALR